MLLHLENTLKVRLAGTLYAIVTVQRRSNRVVSACELGKLREDAACCAAARYRYSDSLAKTAVSISTVCRRSDGGHGL